MICTLNAHMIAYLTSYCFRGLFDEGMLYLVTGISCLLLQAFQKLGIEKIPCKVRKANQNTLKMHLM